MNFKHLKKKVAIEAINYLHSGITIGVGTGSTVFYLIKELKKISHLIYGAVSSSKSSTYFLKNNKINIININQINSLQIYIDSADEVDDKKRMIKGGGGALTGEKIISSISDIFICIVDKSKKVSKIGSKFPIPIEVIPMSTSYVCQEIKKLGGIPKVRKNFFTDYGNIIIDVYHLNMSNPLKTELYINSIVGVVTVGIFAKKKADIVLISSENGIKIL
ncbi:ribose-5-phosphate isomerase RpiA [Buchnera aphidicola (Thelaxes californica)]|uniref:Ribose-5-phosphate isomerase A n=1 Tax=Buchnera aphidicola (Thelaxes californica) TaxID=1315998 RepID=A0A4D6YLJ6_9GAMM|nr:ribose-5-phosphate isomerase RpiA [Buchnera aphidicola]QCI26844.1 ribose-5-phosphate isomerase RpiA [Buchnera aphidicola (Thelaxes californica)]